jgi:hypothetical protein
MRLLAMSELIFFCNLLNFLFNFLDVLAVQLASTSVDVDDDALASGAAKLSCVLSPTIFSDIEKTMPKAIASVHDLDPKTIYFDEDFLSN